MSDDNKVKIQDKEFIISPLLMKHLREISEILKDVKKSEGGIISALDRWVPYIQYSLKKKNPEYKDELLDELTLEEFTEIWFKVTKVSGVTFTATGEQKPKDEKEKISTSQVSTDALPLPSASPIQ